MRADYLAEKPQNDVAVVTEYEQVPRCEKVRRRSELNNAICPWGAGTFLLRNCLHMRLGCQVPHKCRHCDSLCGSAKVTVRVRPLNGRRKHSKVSYPPSVNESS